MPGQFTNAAIQKALQVSQRASGALCVQLLLPGHFRCEAMGFFGALGGRRFASDGL